MPAPHLVSAFARFYTTNFDRRPVVTLSITNGVLNTIADALAQSSQIMLTPSHLPSPVYDPVRTLRFAVFGAALGPIIGAWMRLLERAIPMRALTSSTLSGPGKGGMMGKMGKRTMTIQLVKRVMADQILMAPLGLAFFVTAMGFMEGRSVEEIGDKFKDMYTPALLSNWKVWPLAQAINFRLMPLQYRVPFQSTCGIAWNVYLSLLNAKDQKHLAEAKA